LSAFLRIIWCPRPHRRIVTSQGRDASCEEYTYSNDNNNNLEEGSVPRLTQERAREYWRRNISLVKKLLLIWFIVSFGCGILLVDVLNEVQIGGYKLGFWFAQQGSIYVFVALIFYYAKRMAALDHEFGLDDE
jgi:putative solute:sodium symporter small subunit